MQLLLHRSKFAATATAPACARMLVKHTLTSWLLPHLVDDAQLIVSELVTNAVQATGSTNPDLTHAELANLALLAVQLRVAGRTFFIEVWDNGKEKPGTSPSADKDPDEGGRGLSIVGALSLSYGAAWFRQGGQVVWASLDAGPEIATVPQLEPTPLPRGYRRVVFSEARQPNEHAVADLALMDRITYEPSPTRS